MVTPSMTNCTGCKWLDQNRHGKPGDGYCVMAKRQHLPGARYSTMPKCGKYEVGDWRTRWA